MVAIGKGKIHCSVFFLYIVLPGKEICFFVFCFFLILLGSLVNCHKTDELN